MKKVTLSLLLTLSVAVLSFGQYLNEGFENNTSIPATWTLNQVNANETWQISTGSNPHTGSNYAIVQYDAGQQNESLITSSIDLSSATNPRLIFWWNMKVLK